MHNMSNQPFKYISEKIITYFQREGLNAGERYNLFIEHQDKLDFQYSSLKEVPEEKVKEFEYSYPESDESYETFMIKINDVNLIVSKSSPEHATVDYLTMLRNKVAEQVDPKFQKTAILILFSGNLDSILGGSGSLLKEGMPLHSKTFLETLEEDIKSSNCKEYEKKILNKVITRTDFERDDNESIYELASVVKAITNNSIDSNLYPEFGLFPHDELYSLDNINDILDKNFDFYEKIEYIFKYGNPESELDRHVSEKGKRTLIKEDWHTQDFSNIEKWKSDLENVTPPTIVSCKGDDSLGITIWKRFDGESVAKKRNKNIFIFNTSEIYPIVINVEFDVNIKQASKLTSKGGGISTDLTGKKLKVLIEEDGDLFRSVTLYDSETSKKYELKFCVVNFSESYLEAIEGNFIIKKDHILISSFDKIEFNSIGTETIPIELEEEGSYTLYDNQCIELSNDISSEEDLIPFSLKIGDDVLFLKMKQEVEPITNILGINVWKDKRENKTSFKQISEGDKFKLLFQNKEYSPIGDFRKCLKAEQSIVKSRALAWQEDLRGKLTPINLDLNKEIEDKYLTILDFYKNNSSLPSLQYVNDKNLSQLMNDFLSCFINELDSIPERKNLSQKHKSLFEIGTVKELYEEERIKLTPLHPINMAYQLLLEDKIGGEVLYKAILKRLNSNSLLPYLKGNKGKVYTVIDNPNIPEWTFYSTYLNSKLETPKEFVKPLIRSKLKEFTENFSYLFSKTSVAPLKINLVNLGACKEVVEGIFDYYRQQLNKSRDEIKNILAIDISIYGSDNIVTKFEEISFYNNVKELQNIFDVSFNLKHHDSDELLSIFQEKVHFYKKELPKENEEYEYAHVTFHQFNREKIKDVHLEMSGSKSGISLSGILSEVPSVKDGNIYKTGFGTQEINVDENDLINLTQKYNSLANYVSGDNAYSSDMSIFTTINMSMKDELEKLYNCSQWVTFIDPKVNLDFFKARKDLVIVHYSDQYTNTSGFDAITVTNKSKQYQFIVEDFLKENSVASDNEKTLQVINLFNAINGDWLLKLISAKSQFPREKISILSGIKAALSVFHHPDIIWVPISMEEILRISGGAGLNQGDGLFSVKNLGKYGSYSDDLLFIGFEERSDNIITHFYPIELKIGNKSLKKKGVDQAKSTAQLLNKHLTQDTFKSRFYKNFFVTQAIINAEKLLLYNVGNLENWKIVSQKYRTKLRNKDIIIGNSLKEHIGDFAVIHFETDNKIRQYIKHEEHISFTLCEEDGYKFLVEEIDELIKLFIHTQNSLERDILLHNAYQAKNKSSKAKEKPLEVQENKSKIKTEVSAQVETTHKQNGELKVLFGSDLNNGKEVNWFPTNTEKVMHTNTGIIGTMGTGKTQFTKSLITQIHSNSSLNVDSKKIGILIFDYKGDYIKDDFVNATGAKVYTLYHLPYNPLSLDVGENPKPMLPMHVANNIKETISKAFGLGNVQQQRLKSLITEAYSDKGIIKNKPDTWGNPAPTIQDICDAYFADENSTQDSLYAALSSLADFEIFEPNTTKTKSLYSLIEGVTVINLNGYTPDIQNLVVAITLDLFYNQMQNHGHSKIQGDYRQLTKIILVDEADNFLSKGFKSIKNILKEGREYGVGTVLSTQFLNHFSTSDNDYSNYILTWIIHRVNEIKIKEVDSLFSIQSKEQKENLANTIKKLEKHCSIVNLAGSSPIMIKDKAFWELLNDNN
ncbi:DNA phosphorothioation-dependent restriction protein DptH [Saccharicrinis sp. 156]|uniref:DNA phosphorothioation-dependent restriction protein DptH n=1 Tax=Saccharicrinis sp. 156 TaxID=3417574 RepID=UPI003D34F6EC